VTETVSGLLSPIQRKPAQPASGTKAYFFLAEPLLLELDLLELLLLFDPELFDPPDLDAALAISCSPLNSGLQPPTADPGSAVLVSAYVLFLFRKNK
jgi:hypothetical protein